MIEFRNVHAAYDDQLPVLRDVSFTIDDGEFVAFVGTNGAGKSTTMRLMNGLLKPSEGTVLLNGIPTTELRTSEIARKVGFLFQNPDRQICCNTVREELLFGFKAQGRPDEEAQEKVDAMIAHFDFDADAEPFLLNRGTRQLLALASILVTEPEVLILDEPTTGLDYRECCKVMEVIERAHQKGTTVVMGLPRYGSGRRSCQTGDRHDERPHRCRWPHLRSAARYGRLAPRRLDRPTDMRDLDAACSRTSRPEHYPYRAGEHPR